MSENWKIFLATTLVGLLFFWGALLLPTWIYSQDLFWTVLKYGGILLIACFLGFMVFIKPILWDVLSLFFKRYLWFFSACLLFIYIVLTLWATLPIDNPFFKVMFSASYPIFLLIVQMVQKILTKQLSWPLFVGISKTSKVEDWVATKTVQSQGTDARQIPITNNAQFRSVEFHVQSDSNYWRAGVKLVSKHGGVIPLREDKSVLFHLYKDLDFTDHIKSRVYKSKDEAVDKLISVSPRDTHRVKVEVDRENHLLIYVNENEVFKKKYDQDFFEKVYIVAWGDPNEYSVSFKNILFKSR